MNLLFRKKPVVIEAFQMTRERRRDNSEWPTWLHEAWNKSVVELGAVFPSEYPASDGTDPLKIQTMEGEMAVPWGSWIIRGVRGELYACDNEIFLATYDPVS